MSRVRRCADARVGISRDERSRVHARRTIMIVIMLKGNDKSRVSISWRDNVTFRLSAIYHLITRSGWWTGWSSMGTKIRGDYLPAILLVHWAEWIKLMMPVISAIMPRYYVLMAMFSGGYVCARLVNGCFSLVESLLVRAYTFVSRWRCNLIQSTFVNKTYEWNFHEVKN